MQNHRQRVSTSPSQQTALPLQGGTIGELARRTGLTTKAIRYYESIGSCRHHSVEPMAIGVIARLMSID